MGSSPLHVLAPRPYALIACLCALGPVVGCGNAVFAIQASTASRHLEQARELGAESLAPYEFYYAEEHLKQAQSEAGEADYGDARILAHESNQYSKKAIRIAQESHREAGR
jgi:hypothetical protein